jgi:hypothetical protein
MVIGEKFAWAHLPKTGGDATLELFLLFPEVIVLADIEDSNAKHATFSERENEVAGKALLMNLRRLPFWVLSRAQHVARWGVHPDYEPIPMASPQQLSESAFPDDRIALYTDSGRFQIDRWLRMEHLTEDFVGFVSGLTEVSEDRRREVFQLPAVNAHEYDHDLGSWFTPEQIELMYERNPVWTAIEQELYGGLVAEDSRGRGRMTKLPKTNQAG